MAAARKPPRASRKKRRDPFKYSFIYVLTRRTESLSLKKIFFFMFSRLTNRCVLSSLSAVALSFGLFSCGGSGGSGDGESLPSGTMLDLSASLFSDGAGPWNVIIKLAGNGSDLPLVSINAASSSDASPLNIASVVYRRTGSSAILRGNFTVRSGQWTAPGPIVMTNKDKVFVDAVISFDSSEKREACRGTFAGSITYEVFLEDEEEWQSWTATEGTVSYTVS